MVADDEENDAQQTDAHYGPSQLSQRFRCRFRTTVFHCTLTCCYVQSVDHGKTEQVERFGASVDIPSAPEADADDESPKAAESESARNDEEPGAPEEEDEGDPVDEEVIQGATPQDEPSDSEGSEEDSSEQDVAPDEEEPVETAPDEEQPPVEEPPSPEPVRIQLPGENWKTFEDIVFLPGGDVVILHEFNIEGTTNSAIKVACYAPDGTEVFSHTYDSDSFLTPTIVMRMRGVLSLPSMRLATSMSQQ